MKDAFDHGSHGWARIGKGGTHVILPIRYSKLGIRNWGPFALSAISCKNPSRSPCETPPLAVRRGLRHYAMSMRGAMNRTDRRRGFTLIELLVVIAIIAIL